MMRPRPAASNPQRHQLVGEASLVRVRIRVRVKVRIRVRVPVGGGDVAANVGRCGRES